MARLSGEQIGAHVKRQGHNFENLFGTLGIIDGVVGDPGLVFGPFGGLLHAADIWSHTWNKPPLPAGQHPVRTALEAIPQDWLHNLASDPRATSLALFGIIGGGYLARHGAVNAFLSLVRARGRE